ncbi:hypothetical protein [Haloquadratum walsbyi]|uniref:Halo transducer protein n=1 Tax=Haloquadratum walsbyi J07HQW2 TaxID=1238425 RepID=U1PX20_9EURY|nr:hypothetical protein [Haloquadratum walsbyi]ERG96991.1 MAG: hypothetical protein J07HQW2_03477 [Haloquadratum walsbyi J07HQW2]
MIEFVSESVSLDDFIERIAERTDEDPKSIRTFLDPFVDDGAVTSDAIEATVTDVSQILATAETRVDLATRTTADVREAVAAVPDLSIVQLRDRAFEERLADLRADVDELGEDLTAVRTGMGSAVDIYQAGVRLHEITTDAQDIVRVAHDLETELEAFEAWLNSANRRHDALIDEIEAAETSASSIAETIETLQSADEPNSEHWFDATIQTRVLETVVADLRVEEADLREWAEHEEKSFPDDVEARIKSLQDETAASAAALADHPDWDPLFDERLEVLEAELEALEPPIAWAQVDGHIAKAREVIDADDKTTHEG